MFKNILIAVAVLSAVTAAVYFAGGTVQGTLKSAMNASRSESDAGRATLTMLSCAQTRPMLQILGYSTVEDLNCGLPRN